MALRWAIIVLLTYLAVCVLVTFLQTYLIYFPSHHYHATPEDVGFSFEDLTLETSDGLSIKAWYVPHQKAKGSVIFCHGNAGNISDRLHDVDQLHGMGLSVLMLDYRGFGGSEGRPSEQGTYRDAEAAWDYLVKSRGESPDRIILFGRSLGGGVAIELAARHTPAALVVESTFTSLADIGRIHFRFLPVRWLLRHRYKSIEKVPALTCPKLFIHSQEDHLVPFANGRRLFEAAADPKRFMQTPGGHNTGGYMHSPRYADELQAFLDEALQRAKD